jgi:hypothetical protein
MNIIENIEDSVQKFGDGLPKPQFKNFGSYINGIMKSKGQKTIVKINDESNSGKDPSQLNRFLNESKWGVVKIQEIYENDVVKKQSRLVKSTTF